MEAHRKECPLEMKDMENHNKENMREHLMMTNHELADTKAQLAASYIKPENCLINYIKQTVKLTAILMNAQLGPNTAASHANIMIRSRSVHLDSMAEIFKCGNQTCPVTIKMSQYSIKKICALQWYSDPTDPFYTRIQDVYSC